MAAARTRLMIELEAPTGMGQPPNPAVLSAAFTGASASSVGSALAGVVGCTVDPSLPPVWMQHGGSEAAFSAASIPPTVVVSAELDYPDVADQLEGLPTVKGVWSDPTIEPFVDMSTPLEHPRRMWDPNCAFNTSTGSADDVASALGVERIRQDGFWGQNTTIGIVDGGVDARYYPVDGGWSPPGALAPGAHPVDWDEHGNMCAFDSLIAAPKARLFDYGIGRRSPGFLSWALHSFEHAIASYRTYGFPQVLSNSWGLYQDSWDPFPPGHSGNYTHNANHPFTRKVVEAMDLGILVTFAAGNCGDGCLGSARCGDDVGPGKSIRGANGHPRAICVGGVDLHHRWVGYSSQGPATLDPRKPDLCGYTHFTGHTACDNGTSAACPVVAGVLASLRSAFPGLTQDLARRVLTDTAVNLGPVGWDANTGHGVVQGAAAYEFLRRHWAGLR